MKKEFLSFLEEELLIHKGIINLSHQYQGYDFIGDAQKTTTCSPVAIIADADNKSLTEIQAIARKYFQDVGQMREEKTIRITQPVGILLFVFWKRPDQRKIEFIKKQRFINHSLNNNRIVVSWSIDMLNVKFVKHQNPISKFPPVFLMHEGLLATKFLGKNEQETLLAFFRTHFTSFSAAYKFLLEQEKSIATNVDLEKLKEKLRSTTMEKHVSIIVKKLIELVNVDSELSNLLILHQARLSRHKKEFEAGVISWEQLNVEVNRITKAIIGMIQHLKLEDLK